MLNQKWVLMLIMALLFVGCATTKGNWQKAAQLNTVEAYKEFLLKHPQSEFINLARKNIEQLEWQYAIDINSTNEYQKFLEKYPRSEFSVQARQKIEEIYWQHAEHTNTLDAYRLFLRRYPRSSYVNTAHTAMELIAWKEAQALNDRSAFQQYLQNFPKGKHSDGASAKLEKFDFEDALSLNTIPAIESFIKHYPNGKLLEEAKAKRDALYFNKSTKRASLTLPDIQIDKRVYSTSDVVISQQESGGALKVTGRHEFTLGGGQNLFGLNASHKYKGRVEMQGLGLENYVFIGNESDPLTFWVMKNGYTYAGGKGFVMIKKSGEIIRLGF